MPGARAERTVKMPFQERDRLWQRDSDGNAFGLRQRSALYLDCGRHVGGSVHSGSEAPFVPVMKSAEPGHGDHLGMIRRGSLESASIPPSDAPGSEDITHVSPPFTLPTMGRRVKREDGGIPGVDGRPGIPR